MLCELPLELRDSKAVRHRLAALAGRNRRRRYDRATALRLRLLDEYRVRIAKLDADEKAVCRELSGLVRASGSTLDQLCGLSTRSVAELLMEIGGSRRFTEGGFARFDAQRRWRPRPRRDPASRSATAITAAATGGSTGSCT